MSTVSRWTGGWPFLSDECQSASACRLVEASTTRISGRGFPASSFASCSTISRDRPRVAPAPADFATAAHRHASRLPAGPLVSSSPSSSQRLAPSKITCRRSWSTPAKHAASSAALSLKALVSGAQSVKPARWQSVSVPAFTSPRGMKRPPSPPSRPPPSGSAFKAPKALS
ncbi:MAG: hypothetical protein DYH12_35365 [Sorangiineae bacterium PRO1]|nr:hypothetical protein [Sorangiineae bacterium PRO1]